VNHFNLQAPPGTVEVEAVMLGEFNHGCLPKPVNDWGFAIWAN